MRFALPALALGLAASSAPAQWVDVADSFLRGEAGSSSKAAAWADLDGDGRIDLLWSPDGEANRLALNDGDGTFTPGAATFLDPAIAQNMAAIGDVDGDGDLDVFYGNWSAPAVLARNEGGGLFTLLHPDATVEHRSRGVALADLDGDGVLDVYVSTQGNSSIGEDRLYRGLGDGSFADITPALLAGEDKGRGIVWADFDDDGDVDLYVANGNGCPCDWETIPPDWIPAARNRMYRNDGGVLVDVTDAVTGDLGNGRGVAAGDYDGDGDLDLFVANLAIEGEVEGPKNVGRFGGANRLLRNDGDFRFTDVTPAAMGRDDDSHRSVAWVDVDHDGRLDLHLVGLSGGNSRLWRNLGDGAFVELPSAPLLSGGDGRSAAWGDFDDDGDLDVYLTFGSSLANRLMRNDLANASGNGWLQVRLTGTSSNRSAIGARVIVSLPGGMRMVREVAAGSGYWAQHQLDAHFGTARRDAVRAIVVRWPSGLRSERRMLAVNRRVALTEPAGCGDLADGLDCNGNGVRDECDVASASSLDVDGNGVPDECQECDGDGIFDPDAIASGRASDCDGNGIPDECDIASGADCDGNGLPDDCDLAGGGADCNANGIPDACDLAGGAADCDGNGIPDACDLDAGAADCNANGVPDACDLASGRSADRNRNGVPDECDVCTGDLDDDFIVGFGDLVRVLSAWGPCPVPPGVCPADIDEDDLVGLADLITVLANWGPCGS